MGTCDSSVSDLRIFSRSTSLVSSFRTGSPYTCGSAVACSYVSNWPSGGMLLTRRPSPLASQSLWTNCSILPSFCLRKRGFQSALQVCILSSRSVVRSRKRGGALADGGCVQSSNSATTITLQMVTIRLSMIESTKRFR